MSMKTTWNLEGVSLQQREDGYHLIVPQDQKNNPLADKLRQTGGRTKIDCIVEFGGGSGTTANTDRVGEPSAGFSASSR